MTSGGRSTATPPSARTLSREAAQQQTQPLTAEDRAYVRAEAAVIRRLHDATADKYELLGRLGQGGMGAVYLARDLALGRLVAIKVMLPEFMTDLDTAERFRREARTVASLNHPNIIPVYAVHETDDLAYFVMRYVEGRTLDSILRHGGRLPPPLARAVLGQVGRGLAYAHRHGVVHRDIKPANIMIDEEGWALIADFGIAKVRGAKDLTLAGTTVGTPTYMSPEQCSDHEVTSASDQYALGVVAFELLTGRVPFDGSTIASVVKQQLFDPPPPLEEVYPDCEPALAQAVNRMLAKGPHERWPSVEEAVRQLTGGAAVDGEPVRAAIAEVARGGEVPVVTLLPTAPITPTTAPVTALPPGVRVRRSRRLGSIVGFGSGAVGTAVLAVALFVLQSAPPEPSAPANAVPAAMDSAAIDSAVTNAPDDGRSADDPASAVSGTERAGSGASAMVSLPAARSPDRAARGRPSVPRVGSVLLGTRGLPAVLHIDGVPKGAVSGLHSWPAPAGEVRLSIHLEGCEPWDSTVVVDPGRELRVGYRSPRCAS